MSKMHWSSKAFNISATTSDDLVDKSTEKDSFVVLDIEFE